MEKNGLSRLKEKYKYTDLLKWSHILENMLKCTYWSHVKTIFKEYLGSFRQYFLFKFLFQQSITIWYFIDYSLFQDILYSFGRNLNYVKEHIMYIFMNFYECAHTWKFVVVSSYTLFRIYIYICFHFGKNILFLIAFDPLCYHCQVLLWQ